MTQEQIKKVKEDISRAIPDIARKNGLHNDDIEAVLEEMYSDDDDFTIFCWPEVQDLMLHEDFYNNAVLMNEPWAMNEYGSQTYLVNKAWLKGLE